MGSMETMRPSGMAASSCSFRHLFGEPQVIDLEHLARDLVAWNAAGGSEDVTNSRIMYLPAIHDSEVGRWPGVIEERPARVQCFVDLKHQAEVSVLLGTPNSTQRWLDLCTRHAEELDSEVAKQASRR